MTAKKSEISGGAQVWGGFHPKLATQRHAESLFTISTRLAPPPSVQDRSPTAIWGFEIYTYGVCLGLERNSVRSFFFCFFFFFISFFLFFFFFFFFRSSRQPPPCLRPAEPMNVFSCGPSSRQPT